MAHFYGMLKGSRGLATRLGSKARGLWTVAASWHGAVRSQLSERNGQDWATVELEPWHGHGINRVLYDGPVSGAEQTRDGDRWSQAKGGDRE